MKRAESKIIDLLAECEQALLSLEREIKSVDAKANETIEQNITYAKQSVTACLEEMADKNFDNARVLANVAMLRTRFAKRAFEAESIELLIGEADFLPLNQNWLEEAEGALYKMEQSFNEIQNAVGKIDSPPRKENKDS